jgi:hypothetical protein
MLTTLLTLSLVAISASWLGTELSKPHSWIHDFKTVVKMRMPVPKLMLVDDKAWHDHFCEGTEPSGCIPNIPINPMDQAQIEAVASPEFWRHANRLARELVKGGRSVKWHDHVSWLDFSCCYAGKPETERCFVLGEFPTMWILVKHPLAQSAVHHTKKYGTPYIELISKHHCRAAPRMPLGVLHYMHPRGRVCTPDHYRVFLNHSSWYAAINRTEVGIYNKFDQSYRPTVWYPIVKAARELFFTMPVYVYTPEDCAIADSADLEIGQSNGESNTLLKATMSSLGLQVRSLRLDVERLQDLQLELLQNHITSTAQQTN